MAQDRDVDVEVVCASGKEVGAVTCCDGFAEFAERLQDGCEFFDGELGSRRWCC